MGQKRKEAKHWEAGNYEIEYIVRASYVIKHRCWIYRVKWAGEEWKDPMWDEWKTLDELTGCEELLRRFWREIGVDLLHHPYIQGTRMFKHRIMGNRHEVAPSAKWIKEEKARFHKSHESSGATITIAVRKSSNAKRKRNVGTGNATHAAIESSASDSDDEPRTPKRRALNKRISTKRMRPTSRRVIASPSSSTCSDSSSNSDSESAASEDGHQSEYEVVTIPLPAGGRDTPTPAFPAMGFDDDDLSDGTDSATELGSAFTPDDTEPESSDVISELSSVTESDTEDERVPERSVTPRQRSSLFTPAPGEDTISPPRTPSPVERLSALPQAPATVAHGPIQMLPVKGTYSSLNSTRNKVAQQYGLSITPYRPRDESSPEPPAMDPAAPEDGSAPLNADVDSDEENDISDMLVQVTNVGLYDKPDARDEPRDVYLDFAAAEWASAPTSWPRTPRKEPNCTAQRQPVPSTPTTSNSAWTQSPSAAAWDPWGQNSATIGWGSMSSARPQTPQRVPDLSAQSQGVAITPSTVPMSQDSQLWHSQFHGDLKTLPSLSPLDAMSALSLSDGNDDMSLDYELAYPDDSPGTPDGNRQNSDDAPEAPAAAADPLDEFLRFPAETAATHESSDQTPVPALSPAAFGDANVIEGQPTQVQHQESDASDERTMTADENRSDRPLPVVDADDANSATIDDDASAVAIEGFIDVGSRVAIHESRVPVDESSSTPPSAFSAMEVDAEADNRHHSSVLAVSGPVAASAPHNPKTSTRQWRGPISVKVGRRTINLADVVCTVAAPSPGSKLDLADQLIAHRTCLRFATFHSSDEIIKLCEISGPTAQRATISAAAKEDEEGVDILVEFLRTTQRGAVLPYVGKKGDWQGNIIVHATSRKEVGTAFGAPSDDYKQGPLKVKIFPLGGVLAGTPMVLSAKGSSDDDEATAAACLDEHSFLLFAAKSCGFKDDLLNLLRNAGHGLRYHLVDAPASLESAPSLSASLVRFVLEYFGATETRAQAARIVFVPRHGSSQPWHLPVGLPALLRNPELHVYAYEASAGPSKGPRTQEIFVARGILTTTPHALVSDLFLATSRLEQGAAHPMWSSYILPSILGMALTMYYEGKDPMEVYKANPRAFEFRFLLMSIITRRCHLAVPPSSKTNAPQRFIGPQTAEDLIQLALDEFRSHFDDIPRELWESRAKALLVQDIDTWRMDPEHVLIRHCCVLVHPRDPALSDDIETKIDWMVPSREIVCDGFFDDEDLI
ncbi:uncharacterized protein SCHCODRAFT_02744825 [Schizophyllum commune H4-8]|nr:uncharacterized protein SCHCODRAFT_02744825 [Schizophyllum commune H4-8]KAI5898614.1 hypothetical protein SCHCODRAFT_02744825 [Schizophyllum commune H4-8]